MKKYDFSGFSITYCPEFNKVLRSVIEYPPASLRKDKIDKEIGKTILPFATTPSLKKRIFLVLTRRSIFFSIGFYSKDLNKIFINMSKFSSLKAKEDCSIEDPNVISSILKRKISELVVHELIHFIFANHTDKVVSFTLPVIKKFYKDYWSGIVNHTILNQIANANASIALLTEKANIDLTTENMNSKLIQRFLKILNNINKNHREHIRDTAKFDESLQIIISILTGTYPKTSECVDDFDKAYNKNFGKHPYDVKYGQELVFASEIFAVSSAFRTSQSRTYTKKLLNLL